MQLLEFSFSSFWRFVGMFLCLSAVAQVVFVLINRLLLTINIALRGWPPPHLDADGDQPQQD